MMYFDFKNNTPISGSTIKALLGHIPSNNRLADIQIYPYERDESKSDLELYAPGPVVLCGCEEGGCKAVQTYTAQINSIAHFQEQVTNAFTVMRAALSDTTSIVELRSRLTTAVAKITDANPVSMDGYYPLYCTEDRAQFNSDDGQATSVVVQGITFYMPNSGTTLYTGDYEPS